MCGSTPRWALPNLPTNGEEGATHLYLDASRGRDRSFPQTSWVPSFASGQPSRQRRHRFQSNIDVVKPCRATLVFQRRRCVSPTEAWLSPVTEPRTDLVSSFPFGAYPRVA